MPRSQRDRRARTLRELRERVVPDTEAAPAQTAQSLPLVTPLESALRDHVDAVYDGIQRVPGMWGTPPELEAIWRQALLVEAILLYPTRSPHDAIDAARNGIARVAHARGWPGNCPLHYQARDLAVLLPLLKEWRTEFLRLLRPAVEDQIGETIKAWDDYHRDHASKWDGVVDVEKELGRDD